MSSTKRARALLALGLCAAAACHSHSSAPPAGTANFCGAICASGTIVLGATSSADGLRFFLQSSAGEYPALAFFASLPGTTLEALTYDAANGASASTVVVEAASGGAVWTQATAAQADVGSFSLALTDAGPAVAIDGGTGWPSPEGQLEVTLLSVGTITDAGIAVLVTFPTSTSACRGTCAACPSQQLCMAY